MIEVEEGWDKTRENAKYESLTVTHSAAQLQEPVCICP